MLDAIKLVLRGILLKQPTSIVLRRIVMMVVLFVCLFPTLRYMSLLLQACVYIVFD